MTIRNKLSILSTLLLAFTLGIVLLGTYLLFKTHTRDLYFKRLLDRANTVAHFYFEKDELNDPRYKDIEARYKRIYHESIRVYDAAQKKQLILDSLDYVLPDELFSQIITSGDLTFQEENRQFAGLFYKDNQGDFIIVVSGTDTMGNTQLAALRNMLLLFYLLGIPIQYLMSAYLARRTFKPFSNIIHKVNTITTENLHSRLDVEAGNKDEMQELAITFNYLLERLEKGIQIQKNFLKNASHELKTPLTIIIGDIDVTLNYPKSNEDYQALLQSLKNEALHLKSTLDGLLILSGLEIFEQRKMQEVRVDEILWSVLEKKTVEYDGAKLSIDFGGVADNARFLIKGSRELLFVALANILDNAIKFSTPSVVFIAAGLIGDQLTVTIADQGPGIDTNDKDSIFEPFYRGGNTRHVKGQGIGLYITKQILDMHGITLKVDSVLTQGTCVTLVFSNSA